eukprot:CAMPEP_0202448480 /NCGR_PEP_ID=MMETSP1360-20130828/7291_1 /ASSEMBLY_ACC=CAM_ASM_000848 /TAXON_ID=515479 /ORGANISM="Licmophora paradoxa, Strain CCMP2313" /LENGTH=162 /DNA_ID=CAMNT_0049066065 /DNA_START=44 /DNA_END=532 /DNA_ORIENTATION=+
MEVATMILEDHECKRGGVILNDRNEEEFKRRRIITNSNSSNEVQVQQEPHRAEWWAQPEKRTRVMKISECCSICERPPSSLNKRVATRPYYFQAAVQMPAVRPPSPQTVMFSLTTCHYCSRMVCKSCDPRFCKGCSQYFCKHCSSPDDFCKDCYWNEDVMQM